MATFNPMPPAVNAQEFLNYSKVVEAPSANLSKATAINTASSALGAGVELADTLVKKSIDTDTRTDVEKQRDDYTQYLETLKGMVTKQGNVPGSNTQAIAGRPLSFADEGQTPKDPAITAIDDATEGLGALKQGANQGKINDTYFTMNLNSVAKNLRNKYGPGYADYVDQKIAQYSGMNPANAYYKNLLQDINTVAGKGDTENKRAEALIWSKEFQGLPNAAELSQGWKNGQITNQQIYEYNAKFQGKMRQIQLDDLQRSNATGNEDYDARKANKDFTRRAGTYVQSYIETRKMVDGSDSIQGTIQQINNMIEGKTPFDPKAGAMAATVMGNHIAQIELQLQSDANKINPKTGESAASLMGGADAVQKQIEAQLKPLRMYADYLSKGKYDLASHVSRQITAIGDQDQYGLLTGPQGKTLRTIQAFEGIAKSWGPAFIQQGYLKGLDKDVRQLFEQNRMEAIVQPDWLSNPVTLKKQWEDAVKGGVAPESKYFNNLFSIADTIADKNAPLKAREGAAIYSFHPDNAGMLNNLKKDYWDPVQKAWIPGQNSVYVRMTSPDITDGMWKQRSESGRGLQNWENYKQWGEREFGTLFRSEIQTMQQYENEGFRVIYNNNQPNRPRFSVEPIQGVKPANYSSPPQLWGAERPPVATNEVTLNEGHFKVVQAAVNRLNSGLGNLANIQSKEGGSSTDAYLIRTMATLGFDPNKVTGIPKQMVDSIFKANEEQTNKDFRNK